MKKYIFQIILMLLLCAAVVTVQAANMVAHYEFENNLNDTAGDWDGTALGTIGYAQSHCAGGNHCLEITAFGNAGGTTDGVVIEGSELLLDAEESMSIALWFKAKLPCSGNRNWDAFVNKHGPGSSLWNETGWGCEFTDVAGNICFMARNGGSYPKTTNKHVDDGQWHHLVFTYASKNEYTPYDGNSRTRVYIDGVQAANRYSDPCGAIKSSSTVPITIGIGIQDGGGGLFIYKNEAYGWIDDVRLYDDFLTTPEVQALYASTKSVPLITGQPQSQVVDVGSNITFTVLGSGALSYTWYKSADASNLTPGDDTVVGTDSNTLTINNVQSANEGYYYCVLAGTYAGDNANSAIACLLTKHLISEWQFEYNLNDSIGGCNGTRTNAAVYNTGVKAGTKALNFACKVNDKVVVPFNPEHNVKSFTISAWAKAAIASDPCKYGAVVSTRNVIDLDPNDERQGYLFYAQPVSGHLQWSFWTGIGTTGWYTINGPTVTLGQWTLLTATYDYTTYKQSFYVNGLLVGSETSTAPFVPDTATNLFIGCGNNEGTGGNPFNGDIDDVRYYSYVLSAQEVGQLYANVSGQPLCVGPYSDSDYNQDCVVDAKDFAEFVGLYLNVTSEPPCVGPYSKSDYNHDCAVDLKDFAEFAENWLTKSGMVYPQ